MYSYIKIIILILKKMILNTYYVILILIHILQIRDICKDPIFDIYYHWSYQGYSLKSDHLRQGSHEKINEFQEFFWN